MFIDECGDPFIERINNEFPILTLCGVIVSQSQLHSLNEKVATLKKHFWGDQDIFLHSRDIRKIQKGFEILLNPEVKQDFYDQINSILGEEGAFTIISCSILKQDFVNRNDRGINIYGLALSRLIERSIFYLDKIGCGAPPTLKVILEMRGKKEDKALFAYYEALKTNGTQWLTPARLNSHITGFSFRSKKSNLAGLQVADLIAYPIARHVLDPKAANRSYDILKCNIFTYKERMLGLTVIPRTT